MNKDINKIKDKEIKNLINKGLKENIDFRVVYFNQTIEIKFIKEKSEL